MNYAQIRKYDVTNGPGVRTTLFVSGCTHNCKECFNIEQQNFKYGNEWTNTVEDEFIKYCLNPNVCGVSILGGEPFQQDINIMFNLLQRICNEVQKPIWIWSGYTYEEIINDSEKSRLLSFIDVLIDGRFELDKRDLSLKYRGSENQRVIDIKKTLSTKSVVEIEIK